jgi:Family of unknown function (DUF6084)
MPDFTFKIEGAEAAKFSASPQIDLKLRVANADPTESIHSVMLRAQIQLEVTRRRYTLEEQKNLLDLFGEPERWNQTLHTLLCAQVNINIPPFEGETVIDLPMPCTFDFNVGATKYFYGLDDGQVPLCVLFSGTVFYVCHDGPLQVAPISWDKEARFNLPVRIWHDMMDAHYPNSAWLRLRRDLFQRLHEYKVQNGIPTWEEVFERMLPSPMLKSEEAARR